MLSFHSIWTKPTLVKGGTEIPIWDFEWLTWLASILYARKYGPVVLVADARGKAFVENLGLAPFYQEIILGLDEIPTEVDPEIFWAAGKLYAIPLLKRSSRYSTMDGPIVSLDWDCIPWNYPKSTSEIMCLNMESLRWPWYKDCRPKYQAYVPDYVNWNLSPANNGVFHFRRYKHMVDYAKLSIGFMEKFSKAAREQNYFGQPHHVFGDAMTFAEQQLLPSAAQHSGTVVQPFLPARADGFVANNPFFTHLWTTKALYRAFPEARVHYTQALCADLLTNFPDCRRVLKAKGLGEAQEALTPQENAKLNEEGRKHFQSHNVGIVTSISGEAKLKDRNIFGLRTLKTGSIMLPGDTVICSSSATKIELEFNQTSEYPA